MCSPIMTALKVSCLHLTISQWQERVADAQRLAEELTAERGRPCGHEIMWHPDYDAQLIACVSNTPLHQVATWLDCLDNAGACLNFIDYCYLSDVLREGLANRPTQVADVRLRRALAWAKQAGTVAHALIDRASTNP